MDQSHQINNMSVISASFRGERRKSEAQLCQVASPGNNPCQISFGGQDLIQPEVPKASGGQEAGKGVNDQTALELVQPLSSPMNMPKGGEDGRYAELRDKDLQIEELKQLVATL